MSNEIFKQQLTLSLQRLEELWQRADNLPPLKEQWQEIEECPAVPKEILIESLTELTNSLEELQVVVEELNQQNYELMVSKMAVEAERQRYKELFEFASEGYVVTTQEGVVIEANHKAVQLLNISSKRIISKPLVVFIAAEERRRFYSQLNQLQQGKSIKDWQVQIQRPRGACFTALITVSPIKNLQGKVERLQWHILDLPTQNPNSITSPLNNELEFVDSKYLYFSSELREKLKVQQEQPAPNLVISIEEMGKSLNTLLANSSDLLFICDCTGKYIYVNPAVEKAWDLTQKELIGKTWQQLKLPSEIIEQLEFHQNALLNTGIIPSEELSFSTKEGLKSYHYKMTKLSGNNSSLNVIVVIFQDCTEQKQVIAVDCEILPEKETKFRLIESYSTSILTQELRNPINNIFACSKQLEGDYKKETDVRKLPYLKGIQVNAKRLGQLLDDLLLISKIETKKAQLKPSLIDLNEFCRKLIEELQLLAGVQHKITFTNPGKPCGVWDEKLLRQTLLNLILSAIKNSPKGSKIQLEVVYQARQVIFRIHCLGSFISKEEQKFLTNTYTEKMNVNNPPENGLRLLLVKECVEVQQGKIFVEAQEEVGTIFTVKLPLNQRAEKKK